MDLGLAGNAALVTGSTRGLGKAAATVLAEEGANVMLNGRDEERLEDALTDVRERRAGASRARPRTSPTPTTSSDSSRRRPTSSAASTIS